MVERPSRFRCRFPSLRWAAVAVLFLMLIGIGLTNWQFYRQRGAIKGIERLGGNIVTKPGTPAWLERYIGAQRLKPLQLIVRVETWFSESIGDFEPHLRVFLTRPKLVITSGGLLNLYRDGDEVSPVCSDAARDLLMKHPILITSEHGDWTPLHLATRHNDLKTIDFLLEKGVSVNLHSDSIGGTPLCIARDPEVARFLIARGADPECRTPDGETVLECKVHHLANREGDDYRRESAVIAVLLAAGAQPSIRTACGLGDVNLVRQFLSDPALAHDEVALRNAVQNGHLEIVKLLLEHGAKATPPTNEDRDPSVIFLAIQQPDLLKVLLDSGVSVNDGARPSRGGPTLLHRAAACGATDSCKVLLDRGASIHQVDGRGDSALHRAARSIHLETVKFLLERGTDAGLRNNSRQTPMHLAAAELLFYDDPKIGDGRAIIDLLMTHGQPLDFESAVVRGDIAAVQRMTAEFVLSNTIPPGGWQQYFDRAVELNQPQIVDYLLSAGASADSRSDGSQPLQLALEKGFSEVVQVLLEHGAVNTPAAVRGWSRSFISQEIYFDLHSGRCNLQRRQAAFKVMLAHGVSEDLWMAVLSNDAGMVQAVLEKSPGQASAVDDAGRPVLHRAVVADQREIVSVLVAAGADVNQRDQCISHWTPATAPVIGLTQASSTALHWAAIGGRVELAQWLIQRGADVNLLDNARLTPLHYAVASLSPEIVKASVQAGANRNLKNKDGRTAQDLAKWLLVPVYESQSLSAAERLNNQRLHEIIQLLE